jgi:hypothetical protein
MKSYRLAEPGSRIDLRNTRDKTSLSAAILHPIYFLSALLIAFISAEPVDVAIALFSLPIIVFLLDRGSEPPFLTLGGFVLWLTCSIRVLYYPILMQSTLEDHFGSPTILLATRLSLAACIVVCLGIRLALYNHRPLTESAFNRGITLLKSSRLTATYFVFVLLSFLISEGIIGIPSSIKQFWHAFEKIKWVFFFFAVANSAQAGKFGVLFWLMILTEIIIGFVSYWSSFKNFVPFLIGGLFCSDSSHEKYKIQRSSIFISVTMSILALAILWQCVKSDYRDFISRGDLGRQSADVAVSERLPKLLDLTSKISSDSVRNIIAPTVDRIGNIDTFAMCLNYIPAQRPFDEGKGWWQGFIHIFIPRLFYPSKEAVSDSLILTRYTGKIVSEGTSMNLGYIGETYADFGPFWMFGPLLGVGLMYGFSYRLLTSITQSRFLGVGFAGAVLTWQIAFVQSVPKLLGNTILSTAFAFCVLIIFERQIYSWLTGSTTIRT